MERICLSKNRVYCAFLLILTPPPVIRHKPTMYAIVIRQASLDFGGKFVHCDARKEIRRYIWLSAIEGQKERCILFDSTLAQVQMSIDMNVDTVLSWIGWPQYYSTTHVELAKREHIEISTRAVGRQTVWGVPSFRFKQTVWRVPSFQVECNFALQHMRRKRSHSGLDERKEKSADCTKQNS